MNVETRGMVMGMVFGDGYVNTTGTKSELSITHSLTQADYCEHKAMRLRTAFSRSFSIGKYRNGPGGRYQCLKFCCSHPYFKTIRHWVYPGGKKYFSRQALDMLTPEGIAYWYMDDGSARRNLNDRGWTSSVATDIATCCSKVEAETIVEYFWDVHRIGFKVRCSKTHNPDHAFTIQANTEQSRWFVRLIQPFVIPSMLYKIAHVADLTAHEPRDPTGRCSECQKEIFDGRRNGLCVTCYSRKRYRDVRKARDELSTRGYDIVRPAAEKEAVEAMDKEPLR